MTQCLQSSIWCRKKALSWARIYWNPSFYGGVVCDPHTWASARGLWVQPRASTKKKDPSHDFILEPAKGLQKRTLANLEAKFSRPTAGFFPLSSIIIPSTFWQQPIIFFRPLADFREAHENGEFFRPSANIIFTVLPKKDPKCKKSVFTEDPEHQATLRTPSMSGWKTGPWPSKKPLPTYGDPLLVKKIAYNNTWPHSLVDHW